MATKTGNICISGTMRDSVEIERHVKVSASDCNNNGQPEIARLAPKRVYFHFRLSIIVKISWTHFCQARRG